MNEVFSLDESSEAISASSSFQFDLFALRLGLTNALRTFVPLRPQRFRFDLERLALFVERQVSIRVKCESASGEIGRDVRG